MTMKTHPLDVLQSVEKLHQRTVPLFQQFKSALRSGEAADWAKLKIEDVIDDTHSFKLSWAGVTLLCVLALRPVRAPASEAVVQIYEVKRFEEFPTLLGEEGFNTRTGASEKLHFSQHEDDDRERIFINTAHGAVELIAPYLFKVLGIPR